MKRWLIALAAALLLAGCTGVPVTSDWDPGYDYGAISSYAWLPMQKQQGEDAPFLRNDLMDERIRSAVDAALIARGLRRVEDPAKADVLVNYYMNVEEKVDIQSFHSHFGYYPCFYCGFHHSHFHHGPFFHDDIWVREYNQGTLVIDMLEPQSRKLVWRGVAERRLPDLQDPYDRRLYTVETVDAILARFPPVRQ